jgi:hypothetical protein
VVCLVGVFGMYLETITINSMKTLKERIMMFFGFGYFVNFGTKEIHRLGTKHANCRTEMVTHGGYIPENTALLLLEKEYDGCRYCLNEFNDE